MMRTRHADIAGRYCGFIARSAKLAMYGLKKPGSFIPKVQKRFVV
jgi:hypothetical protein